MRVYGEREFELKQRYFEWLCDLIHVDQGDKSYWILMKDLFRRAFYAIIPHDENRAGDGLELREEFMRNYYYLPEYAEIEGECTVLELLIGLARRMDFETSDPYDDEDDRTVYWFWELIDNLGLIVFDDESYVDCGGIRFVDEIVDRVLERHYKRNGDGGLFPLQNNKRDQRKVELWYQMSAYLAEREAV